MSENRDAVRKYKAFISYRHKPLDKEAAERIQKSIERYTVPSELREKTGGQKLGLVFRDEDELPVSSSLSDSITYALDHAEYLIVICTPDLPKSRWCEQEVRYFIETHDREHVIAVLADGQPEISFSPYLLHKYDENGNITEDVEPLAANIAGENHKIDNKAYKKETVRIIAALIGVPFDTLWQRERRARMNRLMMVMGAASAAMAVFLGVTLKQNATISEQNRSLQEQMSSMKVDAGYTALQSFDRKEALRNALDALESNDPAIYDHRAENLLLQSLGAYQYGDYQSNLIYTQSTDIADLKVSADGKYAYLCDTVGIITKIDAETGTRIWQTPSWEADQNTGSEDSRVYPAESAGVLVCRNHENICGLSADDGRMLWNYRYETANDFIAVSVDGKTAALLDRTYFVEGTLEVNRATDLIFLNTETGEETGRMSFEKENREFYFAVDALPSSYGASFSDSGKYFAFAVYERDTEAYSDGAYRYVLIDMDTMTKVVDSQVDYAPTTGNLFLGIAVNEETKDMYIAQYNQRYSAIINMVIHPDREELELEYISHTIGLSKDTDLIRLDYNDVSCCPMIWAGNKVVYALEDTLYIQDRTSAKGLRSYTLAGDILDMEWLDREEQTLSITASGGYTIMFDLTDTEDSFFESYASSTFDQSSLKKAGMIHGGLLNQDENGALLGVPADAGNHVVRTETVYDPHRAAVRMKDRVASYNSFVIPSVSEDNYFVLSFEDSGILLSLFDAATGEAVKTAEIDGRDIVRQYQCRAEGMVCLDEEHIMAGKWILGLDGSISYPEGLDEDNQDKIYAMSFYSKQLSSGDAVSAYDASDSYGYSYTEMWLNGKLIREAYENGSEMILSPKAEYFGIGANGFVTAFGTYGINDENGKVASVSEEPAYVLFDAVNAQRYIVEDLQKDAVNRIIAPGTETDIFACGDDLGRIYLYHIRDNGGEMMKDGYSVGEIRMMKFVPGDRYLVILANTGRVDVLDTQTGETVYSEVIDSRLGNSLYKAMECTSDEQNHRIFLKFRSSDNSQYGRFAILDSQAWTLMLYTDKEVLCRLENNDRIYAVSESEVESYPVYSLEELKAWAEDVLNQ